MEEARGRHHRAVPPQSFLNHSPVAAHPGSTTGDASGQCHLYGRTQFFISVVIKLTSGDLLSVTPVSYFKGFY